MGFACLKFSIIIYLSFHIIDLLGSWHKIDITKTVLLSNISNISFESQCIERTITIIYVLVIAYLFLIVESIPDLCMR